MTYKIYIQAQNGFPISDWAASAYFGFRQKQSDIYFFEDIEQVPVSKYVILIASIENTNVYLEKLRLPPKMSINIPQELISYAGREISFMTLGEFKKMDKFPIFVKPNGRSKEFIAGVVDNKKVLEYAFYGIDDDRPVLVSEVVDFVSEYRGYVIGGELKGIKHYAGDFRMFPDMGVIDQAIKDYVTQPIGYSIDFGVVIDVGNKKQDTLLIEINDGFALGNYGLNDVTYSTLLARRWIQMINKI